MASSAPIYAPSLLLLLLLLHLSPSCSSAPSIHEARTLLHPPPSSTFPSDIFHASRRILDRDLRRRLSRRTFPADVSSPSADHHLTPSSQPAHVQSTTKSAFEMAFSQPPATQYIEVPVVSAGERKMLYYAEVGIGTPASTFRLAVDSGSDPTWVNCTLTSGTAAAPPNLFDASRSSTFFPMPLGCNHTEPCFYVVAPPSETEPSGQRRQCAEIDAGVRHNVTGPCTYEYSYVDGTRTRGIYAYESLTFDGETTGRKVETIALGCGNDNVVDGGRDFAGVMGLGRGGGLTLPFQLSLPSFAHCFQSLANVNRRSILVLGEDPLLQSKILAPLQHTRFMLAADQSLHLTSYYVQVMGVKLNGRPLRIRASSWPRGTTAIDTGSSYSYVPHEAYFAIVDGIKAAAPYPPLFDPTTSHHHQLCYDSIHFRNGEMGRLVGLEFALRGNATLSVPAENLFVDVSNGNVQCLVIYSMASTGADEPAFGNHLFQNIYVQYDRRHNRLGWARAQCTE